MTDKNKIKIIIGLGNEDEKYQKTYHNVGQIFVGYWNAIPHLNPPPSAEGGGKLADIEAVKTEGFMNQSGDAVKKILKERGLKIEDALIVHDDSDIHLGEYKISRNRGAAGHKGVEHIMAVFGTKNFTRLRIGIRPKPRTEEGGRRTDLSAVAHETKADLSTVTRRAKADEFVLKNITVANMGVLREVFKKTAGKIYKTLM